ncbi:hypothetical protein [Azonexus fungiphilus]|uniref:hypothetical protein n=1 Tax=Azonexus fungiphilus TaxID=146940 RepID=UPI0011C46C18|nr:hypothetical protein [Azonexus fungiphilus]
MLAPYEQKTFAQALHSAQNLAGPWPNRPFPYVRPHTLLFDWPCSQNLSWSIHCRLKFVHAERAIFQGSSLILPPVQAMIKKYFAVQHTCISHYAERHNLSIKAVEKHHGFSKILASSS